jgi:mono/diheme cytochrome c family protein
MAFVRSGWGAWVSLFGFTSVTAFAATKPVDFTRDIEPLLRSRCYVCHGPKQQMSGLRLDQKEAALRGGKSGPDIKPGHSADSRLIRLVSGLEGKTVMPPIGPRLTPKEISLLRAWIDQGASRPETSVTGTEDQRSTHWAFQKPQRPELPTVRDRSWVRNPIDNFVLARLEGEGIVPSPEANKTTLIRRVTLDLTGLLPTPQEVQAFLDDNRPDAYGRLVDRLFASPHYGEKWARHWLDLARYADSDGYEKDLSRPWAWRYRQWVIEALNRNMPYDEFTIEQIAGDLLPNATVDQKIATGFNRNTLTNREGGTDPEQFRDEEVKDRTATLGTVWLGLTVGCAQCHDHKYDPISQKEFYELSAFFNTAEEVNIDAPLPGEVGPYLAARPAYEKKLHELYEQYHVAELQADWEQKMHFAAAHPGVHADWDFAYGVVRVMLDHGVKLVAMDPAKRTAKEREVVTRFFIKYYREVISKERYDEIKFKELSAKLKELDATLPPFSQAPTIAQNPNPPKTWIHIKGDYREHGAEVQPAVLSVLNPLPPNPHPNRLTLARWVVSRDNPLTARVAVNRFWQELFGRGIVFTSDDFGTQGEKPSHPKLLDWLAVEFMDHNWDVKYMQRLMVLSATYRQSSKTRPEMETRDPYNILLARQTRLRLPAELIRDEALEAGGLLNLSKIGGPSIRPPQPKGVAELSYANSVKWPETKGPDKYRRGLYIHFQRTTPYPQLVNFDEPNSNLSCTRRQRSNTPLQALNLLNDPVFFEAAQGLAFRLVREAPPGFRPRLNYAFEITLNRKPRPTEIERLAKYYDQELGQIQNSPKTIHALFPNQFEGVPQTEAAAWVGLSRVILNLDEFINRE